MTEAEFWKDIQDTLLGQTGASEQQNNKMLKRLASLLVNQADDLRDASEDERRQLLRQTFVNAGYNKSWNVVQKGFDTILSFQNDLWRNNTTQGGPLSRNASRLVSLEKVRFESFGDLGKKSITKLSQTFKSAAGDDWSRQELIDELKSFSGKVGRYATAIGDTSLRGWDRTVSGTKAEIAGVEKAIYDGPPTRENSHEFCIEHYQQEYTMDEIESMSNGELDPVLTYGGGYNCVHRWRWRIEDILI